MDLLREFGAPYLQLYDEGEGMVRLAARRWLFAIQLCWLKAEQ